MKELEDTQVPNIDLDEGKLLFKKYSFNYQGAVGEIVYAYIIAQPDYAYAVSIIPVQYLSGSMHHDAAKRCLMSLIHSVDKGIWYWRRKLHQDLNPCNHVPHSLESFEGKYLILEDPFLTSGMCDSR